MSDYCEIPEWFSGGWPVARKQYKCCECGSPILKGEKHGAFSGKWDGRVSTYRQHLDCEEACRFIRDFYQDGECIGFGELWEHCGEYEMSKKSERDQHFRTLMAKFKWRWHKKRPLTFIKTRTFEFKSLSRDRNNGRFSG